MPASGVPLAVATLAAPGTAAPGAGADGADAPPAVALRRLRWQARRGLLENDLLLGRYFERHGAALDTAALEALGRLLALPDGELLDLALGRAELPLALDAPAMHTVLAQLRAV